MPVSGFVSGHHGKIARQRFCVGDDCVSGPPATEILETENNDQCDGHDDALDKVCGGCRKESSRVVYATIITALMIMR